MRYLSKTIIRVLLFILVGLVLYISIAGVFLGLAYLQQKPIDETSETITLYVFADYFHADLIIPVHAEASQWDYLFEQYSFQQNRQAINYLSIGWGSEAFYLKMGDWSNLSAGIVFKALTFDHTVLHIAAWQGEFVAHPQLYEVPITQTAYTKILQFVHDSFAKDEQGKVQLIPEQKYWKNDAFFKAKGRYHPVRTCNQWTAEALRLANVPVPSWSPFAHSLIWTLPTSQQKTP